MSLCEPSFRWYKDAAPHANWDRVLVETLEMIDLSVQRQASLLVATERKWHALDAGFFQPLAPATLHTHTRFLDLGERN